MIYSLASPTINFDNDIIYNLHRKYLAETHRDDIVLIKSEAFDDYYLNLADDVILMMRRDINDGDVVFFQDLHNPALAVVDMYRKTTGKKIEIRGLLRELSAYKPSNRWAKRGISLFSFESRNILAVDKLYYAFSSLASGVRKYKIYKEGEVTGLPLDLSWFIDGRKVEKKYEIIYVDDYSDDEAYNIVSGLIDRGVDIHIYSLDYDVEKLSREIAESNLVFYPQTNYMFNYIPAFSMGNNVPIACRHLSGLKDFVPESFFFVSPLEMEMKIAYWKGRLNTHELRPHVEKYKYTDVFNKWYR